MTQVRHGYARTTAAFRRPIQEREDSFVKLARRYGINPKTVAKWRKRDTIEDATEEPALNRADC